MPRPPLTKNSGGPGRNRTCDPAVNNRSLYRLSYGTMVPVGCVDPPGNRKGTEGENWHLTQEAGGFYPANFIQAYFIKRIQWVSVIFVMFYIKSPVPFFHHPPPEGAPA